MAVMGSGVDSFIPVFRSNVNVEVRPQLCVSFGLSSGLHLLGLLILLIITFLRPVRPVPRCDQTPISVLTIFTMEKQTTEITRPRWAAPRQIPANRLVQPRIVAPPALQVDLPKFPVESNAVARVPAIRLREQPVLNTFSGADSSVPKRKVSDQVQTGGFGDPNAVAGAGLAHRPNIARIGSFDLPAGNREVNASGGANGSRSITTSVTFGQAYVSPSPSNQSRAIVHDSGFGDKIADTSSGAKPDRTKSRPQLTPAEIIFKPTPAYTPEARSLKIEGEVVAEVLLSASGQARVVRILEHLGHGLDESAAHTVSEMRFRPAAENGRAVDSVVVIHILFKLA